MFTLMLLTFCNMVVMGMRIERVNEENIRAKLGEDCSRGFVSSLSGLDRTPPAPRFFCPYEIGSDENCSCTLLCAC